MSLAAKNYSPNVLIYLEWGDQKIRLSDVLNNTATLYEPVDAVPPGEMAALVFQIDDIPHRDLVLLDEGISPDSDTIAFSYPRDSAQSN